MGIRRFLHHKGFIAREILTFGRKRKSWLNPKISQRSTQPEWSESRAVLERILTQNILPFWYPQTLDYDDGGFRLNHDIHSVWKGRSNKRLVTQARTLWFFSRLSNTVYGGSEHLAAARHGYTFLLEHLWDDCSGGFFWEVDSSGKTATMPEKHLYGQAFALYALSEYALVTGDSEAARFARTFFDLLETQAHDREHGGYREFFLQDWSRPPVDRKGYLGAKHGIKLMNTQLHLMEAIDRFCVLTGDEIAKERLLELIQIQSKAVVHEAVGACTDQFQSDWTPVNGWDQRRVSYGHDMENIWMLMAACETADLKTDPFQDLFRTLFNYTLQYGFDRRKGGVFHAGYFHSSADSRKKIWWVQAEALLSALKMYRFTGEQMYRHCFSQTLDWITNHQVDWNAREWYETVMENGEQTGDKAGAWKSPYHNGRAILECLQLLDDMPG